MPAKTIASVESGDHLCCLYETEAEHRALLTPFLRQGLERGEKVLYMVDAHTAETILCYLRDDGLEVEPYLASGQLGLLTIEETYTREGSFDPERMIALLQAETERALAQGYAALRVTGEMTWVLRGLPGSERLIEYEARLNTFLAGSRCLAICQYDRRRFAPAVLLDVLTTHPLVVVGTTVYRNLYYIPPAEFLGADRAEAELRHRLETLETGRKADEMLFQSELKLRSILQESTDGIALTDEQGRVIGWNRAIERITGLPAAEVVGRPLWEVLQPFFPAEYETVEGAQQLQAEIRECLRSGWAPWVGRLLGGKYQHPDGTERFVQGVIFPLPHWERSSKEQGGAVQGLVLSVADVTPREQARVALEQYATRLQLRQEIDRAILGAQSLKEIADIVLDYLRRLLSCRRASLAVADPEQDQAVLIAVHSEGESELPIGTTVPLNQVPFLDVLREGRTHIIADLQQMEDLSPPLQQLRDAGVRGYLSIPLMEEGELVGAISVGLDSPAASPPAQWMLVEELAPALAVAVHHARLHEHVVRYAAELQQRVVQRTAELQTSQRDYQALVHSIDGIVWEMDAASFRFLFVSRQAERLLGYPLERWLAEPTFWQDHLHPDDRERVLAYFAEAIAEKRDYQVEYRMQAADGRTVWLRDIVSVVVENDRPVKLRGIMVDITVQKGMQEALLQRERLAAMGQLAATLAHEINNPLQSVIGCLDLAKEGLAKGRDIARYLQVAHEEVQRLRRIVGQMRELYRPEWGDRQPTDLNRLLEEVFALLDQPCRANGIALTWELATGLPLVSVVPDRIKQVFLNLLLNAIEAMPAGGQLSVRTVRTDRPDGIRVEFRDTGLGIAPEALPRLFEPFYTTKPKGSGLGLFISYRIVKEHGGTIAVNSQPGGGSTFAVWLPLEFAGLPEGEDNRWGTR